MSNSILDNLNDSHFKNKINLILSANKNYVYCYVEGESDKAIFKKLLANNIVINNAFGTGKEILKEVVLNYDFNNKNRCIGICDKDYVNNNTCDRIFFCDHSCLEMMIVSDNDCFNNVCCEYCASSVDSLNIRFSILKCLENLSNLRRFNERNNCGINFGGAGIKSTVYDDDETLMNYNIIKELKKMNKNNLSYNQIEQYYFNCCNMQKCKSEDELFDITNGHDFISMCLSVFNKYKCHIKNISIDRIESALRLSFDAKSFKKTKLYTNLKHYQNLQDLCIVA